MPKSNSIVKNTIIDKSVKIKNGCFIGSNFVISTGCVIQSDVRIKNS